MKKKYLTPSSEPEELIRLKKSLEFIREVLRTYELGLFDHLGLSHALALSKAEEWQDRIARSSPAYSLWDTLVQGLKILTLEPAAPKKVTQALQAIWSHFDFDRYQFVSRERVHF